VTRLTQIPVALRSIAFWDSSALIPLCVQERTSNKVKTLAKQLAPVVWWATAVEIHSAIARLHRSGEFGDAGWQAALDRLAVVSRGWREVLPSDKLRDQAGALLDTYSLRAADSLQLASAMIWSQQRAAGRKFVSNDLRLCEAAGRLGFTVMSPGLA
jgi:predicted nucleic acid-binding protein